MLWDQPPRCCGELMLFTSREGWRCRKCPVGSPENKAGVAKWCRHEEVLGAKRRRNDEVPLWVAGGKYNNERLRRIL